MATTGAGQDFANPTKLQPRDAVKGRAAQFGAAVKFSYPGRIVTRWILVACLVALAWPTRAEIIRISGPCSGTRVCTDLAADTGADVQFSAVPSAARFQLVIDGKTYEGTNHHGSQIDEVATANDGTQVVVRVTFQRRVRKVDMGRAHYAIQRWSVTDGTLER